MLPIYNVVFNLDDDEQGLFAVSFVDAPAIEYNFLAMRKNKPLHIYMNEPKHEVVSPLLIPNQLIYRRNGNDEYYIRWSEDTIKNAAMSMILNQRLNWVTVMHPMESNPDLTYDKCLEKGVYMMRLWIIDDPKNDDAKTKYGYDLPKGTLMAHYKVYNRKLWNRIVGGELKGLSIEAVANFKMDK